LRRLEEGIETSGGGGLKRPRAKLGCSVIEEEEEEYDDDDDDNNNNNNNNVNVQSAMVYSNKGASNLNKL
jgi:hypothetical protein